MRKTTRDRDVVLIRPIDQGRHLRETLRNRAQTAGMRQRIHLSPLSVIEEVPGEIDTRGKAGILFTSANAVRIFSRRSSERDLKALCVGKTTTAAAMQAGLAAGPLEFGSVTSLELVERVIRDFRSGGGPYLYVRGSPVARDLVSLLGAEDVPVDEVIVYRQSPAPLTREAKDTIQGQAVCVPVYSAFAARRLADEVAELEIADMVCPCISPLVGDALAGIAGVSVRAASAPSGDVMQELILSCCRLG